MRNKMVSLIFSEFHRQAIIIESSSSHAAKFGSPSFVSAQFQVAVFPFSF